MILEEKANLVLSKLIGLLNGMDEFLPDEKLILDVRKIIQNLKSNENLDESIEVLKKNKAKFLSNCLTCASPCGRTNDYSLNDIENEVIKEDRINEFNAFLNEYRDDMDFNDIIYRITKLSW